MKKRTLIVGVVSSFLLLIGILMKTQHWPGANVVIAVAAALFALGYSILLLRDKNAIAQNNNQKTVNIMTMVLMSVIMICFLFKAMHWPGAGIAGFIGNVLLLIMIPILFIHGSKETDPVKKLNFYNEAILLVILTCFSFFIWLVIGAR